MGDAVAKEVGEGCKGTGDGGFGCAVCGNCQCGVEEWAGALNTARQRWWESPAS